MTRNEIRELASFQADESKNACALSFYFQPDPPQDRSHRREAIVAKDIVKQALKSAAAVGKNGSLHADLDRVLELAMNLRGQARGRAVFACSAQKFWKEYELPPDLGSTRIYLQPQFQLKPLAALLGALPLALGKGVGSELRQPLGITIVGGLILSQMLTLFTTPVIYLWFDRLAIRFAGRPDSVGQPSGSH